VRVHLSSQKDGLAGSSTALALDQCQPDALLVLQLWEVADEEGAVADQLDFTQQANDCFRLAESETQAEIKTILMGMAYGWLTFANRHKVTSEGHRAPVDEPTEEPADDLN